MIVCVRVSVCVYVYLCFYLFVFYCCHWIYMWCYFIFVGNDRWLCDFRRVVVELWQEEHTEIFVRRIVVGGRRPQPFSQYGVVTAFVSV